VGHTGLGEAAEEADEAQLTCTHISSDENSVAPPETGRALYPRFELDEESCKVSQPVHLCTLASLFYFCHNGLTTRWKA